MSNTFGIVSGVLVSIGAAAAITGTILYFVLRKKKIRGALVDSNIPVPVRVVDKYVGNHVRITASIDGVQTIRPYTPVSPVDKKGYVEFVIKVYKPTERFPNGGKMTQYLDKIPVGHYLDVTGPFGRLTYIDRGTFSIKKSDRESPVSRKVQRVGMICGGSGITPMFQLLAHILNDKDDKIEISLLYANNTEDDILLRDELDNFTSKNPNQFRCWYTVVNAPDNWNYSTGFISQEMIGEHICPPGPDTLVLLCGPPRMIDDACLPNLTKIGYQREQIHIF